MFKSAKSILRKGLNRWTPCRPMPPPPWCMKLKSHAEYEQVREIQSSRFAARRMIEGELEEQLVADGTSVMPGYCWVCRRVESFIYDRSYSGESSVNWRERLVCPRCRLNNRLRLTAQVLDRLVGPTKPRIYMTEQVTPFARYVSSRYPFTIKSEYLGPEYSAGAFNLRGVRHEDVTALSFENNSFDFVLTFDVLEHVPAYKSALREFERVLRRGGKVIMTVPFVLSYEHSLIRATVDANDGEVRHLLPPEFHGDPVDPQAGILCYYHFGWDLLEDFYSCGFTDVNLHLYWSLEFGHIGHEQIMIEATK